MPYEANDAYQCELCHVRYSHKKLAEYCEFMHMYLQSFRRGIKPGMFVVKTHEPNPEVVEVMVLVDMNSYIDDESGEANVVIYFNNVGYEIMSRLLKCQSAHCAPEQMLTITGEPKDVVMAFEELMHSGRMHKYHLRFMTASEQERFMVSFANNLQVLKSMINDCQKSPLLAEQLPEQPNQDILISEIVEDVQIVRDAKIDKSKLN